MTPTHPYTLPTTYVQAQNALSTMPCLETHQAGSGSPWAALCLTPVTLDGDDRFPVCLPRLAGEGLCLFISVSPTPTPPAGRGLT